MALGQYHSKFQKILIMQSISLDTDKLVEHVRSQTEQSTVIVLSTVNRAEQSIVETVIT